MVVDILHFVDDGWSEAVVGGLAESLHAVEVEGAVGFAEANGQLAHGRLGKESTLLRDVDIGTVAAVGEQREGGHDVIYGIVRVGALQVECFKEFFEFVDTQAWLDEAGELEGVEALAVSKGMA